MFNFSATEQKLLQSSGVDGLILFGSQAQGAAGTASDFDVLVVGKKNGKIYDLIYDLLAEKINRLTDIDIVFAGNAPLELKHHAIKYGQVLYQNHPAVFADFKQQTMLELADFAPYRAMFARATLARINP